MLKVKTNILITGTPGTGKTTTAEAVATRTGWKHVNVGDLVKSQKLYSDYDMQFEAFTLDEDKLCDALEDMLAPGGCIVDFHSCDFFPERWFGLIVVLRADNSILYERLQKRGYSDLKIRENVEAEIMQVVYDEARDSYDESIVWSLTSNNVDEMEQNIARISDWVAKNGERAADDRKDEDMQ